MGRTKCRRFDGPWLPMESHFSIPSGLETERSRPIIARGRLEEDILLLLLLVCSGDGEREAMSGLSVSLLSSSWYASSSSSTDALRTSDVAEARAARASRASEEAKSPVTPVVVGVFGIVPAVAQDVPEFEFACCGTCGEAESSVSINSASALTVRPRPSSAISVGAGSVEVTHEVEGFGC